MPTDNEAMQILAFGDVYMPDPEAQPAQQAQSLPKTPTITGQPVFEHASPSSAYQLHADGESVHSSPLVTLSASSRPSSVFEDPSVPYPTFHHHPHSPTIPERSTFRSLFRPSSFKGKLSQMMVSCTLLGASLTTCMPFTSALRQFHHAC
jgi:hypothetical protein